MGEEGVGKTSLIQRFVFSAFDEKYLRTVGANVRKKVVDVGRINGAAYEANLLIWDIVGRRDFMNLHRDAYFFRASGILAVCDATRIETLEALPAWLDSIEASVGTVPTVILANKEDLADHRQVREEYLSDVCAAHDAPGLLTSAKTGENVEAAFGRLAEMAVRAALVPREA